MKNKNKKLREQQGISQCELKKVGVSRQAINAVEVGKFYPSILLAYRISEYFELSLRMFLIFGMYLSRLKMSCKKSCDISRVREFL
jgi:putative transcriptional regulator